METRLNNAFYVATRMLDLPELGNYSVLLTLSVPNRATWCVFLNFPKLLQQLPCEQVGRILLFFFDSLQLIRYCDVFCSPLENWRAESFEQQL